MTQSCFGATSRCSPLWVSKIRNRGSEKPSQFFRFSILRLVKCRRRAIGLRIVGTSYASSASPTGSIQIATTGSGRKPSTPPPMSATPIPFRTLPTKAVQIADDQGRNVILEALHFLVEIGNLRHQFVPMAARRKRSPWDQHAQATMWRALIGRDPQIVEPANGNARSKRCPLL